jgi:hypothetical protein
MRVPSNVMKQGAAEVVCRWFLRGTHSNGLAFMQQTPSETVSPYEKDAKSYARHKAWP